MAKKGQSFKKYDDDFRNKVVNDYFNNEGGVKVLAKKYNISYTTIQNWVNKVNKGQSVSTNNYLKGNRKDENIDYKERYEILKKYQAFLKAQRERK